MCGIFGVIGSQTPIEDVVAGLSRLEYRGYDSAGIACSDDGELHMVKRSGKLENLEKALTEENPSFRDNMAIGHTRWATHGEPTENNAHPHIAGNCAVVHNGIIENYARLKKQLSADDTTFYSDTDTEVIPVLIHKYMQAGQSALQAVQQTLKDVEGAFALGIMISGEREQMIAARRGSPLIVGIGEERNYIGSDAIALAPFTNRVIYLENDDVAVITNHKITIYNKDGEPVERPVKTVDVSTEQTGKNGYRHFMLKEIHEQPTVVAQTLSNYTTSDHKALNLPDFTFDLAAIDRVTLVACGTSYHACMVAKYWIEDLAGIPVNVDIASEFRYRKPPLTDKGMALFISQSGETADTLAALEYCQEHGQNIVSLVNVPTSSIARASDVILQTKAGPEIGVASTKAFTTQLTVLALLALKMALGKGKLSDKDVSGYIAELSKLPTHMLAVLDKDNELEKLAHGFTKANSSLFLGRGSLFPIALEGALKLKEISYIHAEGYAAGEMKHGPIALVDENVPVVTIAPDGTLFDKTVSNMREVEARKGHVFLFTDESGADKVKAVSGQLFTTPNVSEFVQPILQTLPQQLLSYHVAVLKGTDVDQPRNLAKSVTVE